MRAVAAERHSGELTGRALPRPIWARRQATRQLPVLTFGQRASLLGIALLWLAANVIFWGWWLRPDHVSSPVFFWLVTGAIFYDLSFLPTMYLFFVSRMRRPDCAPAPAGLRVAMITLCVPSSESLATIERQLRALRDVRYPHDSWVLDEGDDPRVRAAAARYGVRYFTRKGVERYNQPGPPFQAKTKAGNVNAWLDAHGDEYDFFVQLDIDHRPNPDYLDRTLGYFADPQVAWVQAPSVYGNLDSWVARGAAEQEFVLQGPLQMGYYGNSRMPFIIGSHCTYRLAAIREINGFQPTRAEDHLDTVVLAARGYRGVFVPDIIAIGNGPDTFETYLRQQFAWANSMMQVLFQFTPKLVWHYRPMQAIQFLFAQTWYPLWSLSMLVLFLTPILALLTGESPASVALWEFALVQTPVGIVALVLWRFTRRWHLPREIGLSWRGVVLHIARWPIVVWASVNVLFRVKHPYMITPKLDYNGVPPLSLRSQALYLGLASLSLFAVAREYWFGESYRTLGYIFFSLLGAGYMLLVVAVNWTTHLAALRGSGVGWPRCLELRSPASAAFLGSVALFAFTACAARDVVVASMVWSPLSEVEQERIFAASTREQVLALGRQDVATERAAGLTFSSDRLLFGAYDPTRVLDPAIGELRLWFVSQHDAEYFTALLDYAAGRYLPVVTIEPLPSGRRSADVLSDIVAGKRDEEIRRLARAAARSPIPEVLVRWAHEMELDLHYPWSSRPPELYRTAFRRVVGIFREEGASNVRFVWSPAGERQAVPYYPGDDVVDFVGVTVLADPTWDASWGSGPQTFDDVFGPRYQMALRFAKPILIAELGVSSSLPQGSWLDAAAASLARYPQVRGVVYYNARNAPNLRLGYRPDWRISEDLYAAFVTKAARSADASPPVRRVLPLGPEPGATVPLPDADLEPVATR